MPVLVLIYLLLCNTRERSDAGSTCRPRMPAADADMVRRRKLWNITEAAELLNTSRPAPGGEGRADLVLKIGQRRYISDSELDRFVARAEVRTALDKQEPA